MGSWLDGGNKIVLSQKARVQNPSHARDTKHNKQILKPLWQPPTLFWGKGGGSMAKAFYGLIIRPTSIHIQPFVKNNYGLLQQKFSCFGKFTNVNLKKILFVVFFSSANSLSVSPQIAIMQCTQKQQSYILWFQNITFFFGRSAI